MTLTKAQTQITALLAQGLTAEQVASRLCRAVPTVRRHIQLAYERVGARNTPHLVAISIARGLIQFVPVIALCISLGLGSDDAQRRGARTTRLNRREAEVQIYA